MAYSFISSVSGYEPGATGDDFTTASIDTTSADLIVISVAWYPGTTADVTLSDSKSNTWTALTRRTTANTFYRERMYYCRGGTVGTGHTFTVAGTNFYGAMCAMAFSGSAATVTDQETGAETNSASSLATGSITPSEDNCLIVVGINTGDTPAAVSIDGGFTIPASTTIDGQANIYQGHSMAYLIQTTAAAANPTWNPTDATAMVTTIASFKGPGGGGGGVVGPLLSGHLVNSGILMGGRLVG